MKNFALGAVSIPLYLWLGAAACLRSHAAEATTSAPTNTPVYSRIEIPGVHNAFRVTDKVFSGSQPEGDDAFAALARLGVKTIINVDGSKPNVTAAHRYGLRYVHLPFGYDGVPTNRVAELAKAVISRNGPVFVHCHHGLHRGPTAVALICEATANWTASEAQRWMRDAGTSPDYAGLYRSAAAFYKPTRVQLDAVKELPEVTKPSSIVEAMVSLDEHFAKLKLCQKAGWRTPPGQADITPAHEATMLWEQFREIARTPDAAGRPRDYHEKLTRKASLPSIAPPSSPTRWRRPRSGIWIAWIVTIGPPTATRRRTPR